MPARYVVESIPRFHQLQFKVEDTKMKRAICCCHFIDDANNIAKSMNVSDSWDPILMTNEMGSSNYIKKED